MSSTEGVIDAADTRSSWDDEFTRAAVRYRTFVSRRRGAFVMRIRPVTLSRGLGAPIASVLLDCSGSKQQR